MLAANLRAERSPRVPRRGKGPDLVLLGREPYNIVEFATDVAAAFR